MTKQLTLAPWWKSDTLAQKALNGSSQLWFSAVLIGQAIFSFYIVMFYYKATVNKDLERFNQVMPAGYIEGDFMGNVAVIAHVLFAAIITVGGLMQLLPLIRRKWPSLHRYNGRLYISVATIMSFSGMFMVITRYEKIIGGLFGHITIMINGFIIITCAIMAFKYARQKNFTKHRIWALRLFLAVSGVWMFRIGLMAWLSIHGKPVGFDRVSFSGPFLNTLNFIVYILPLFILEIYLQSQRSLFPHVKLMTAFMVILISCIFIIGVFAAMIGMWLPSI